MFMRFSVIGGSPFTHHTDLLVVGVFQDDKNADLKKLDKELDSELTKAKKEKRFTGEFKTLLGVSPLDRMNARRIVFVGLGKQDELTLEKLRRAAGLTAKQAQSAGARSFATALGLVKVKNATNAQVAAAVAEACKLAVYQFTTFKTEGLDKIKNVDVVEIFVSDKTAAAKAVKKADIITDGTIRARDYTNTPAKVATPFYLTNEAKNIAKKHKMKITVMGSKELKKHGMNAILAVSNGSQFDARFVIMEYKGSPKKEKFALVGKGITFDSGGLNIKPGSYMDGMKMDMTGAGVVMSTMDVVARLKLPVNVIGAFPLVENMPSGTSYKPGDVVKAYNGKTMEIGNTDAEGRVVLADALSYIEKNYKPTQIIDLATLTGACVYALGHDYSGLFSTDDKLREQIEKAAEQTDELVWAMPMNDDFSDLVKSKVADVYNIGRISGVAGVHTGAYFLKAFVDKTPWAHLDIAGTAYLPEPKDYIPAMGSGWGVRLLTKYLENKV